MRHAALLAALAASLAACAEPRIVADSRDAIEARRAALDQGVARADASFAEALTRASEACLDLHPRPARATPDALARRRALVLDCFEQRSAQARDRHDRELERLHQDHIAGLERDAAAFERAHAPPPLGSPFRPVWIRPTF